MSSQATQSRRQWCRSAMLMRVRVPTALTHAGTIATAQVTENARPGAGAMAMTTVTERASQPLKKSAPSTRVNTVGDPAGAGTPWTAKVKEPAIFGAIALAIQTADLRLSIYFIIIIFNTYICLFFLFAF